LDYWIDKNLNKSIKKLNPRVLQILRLGYYESVIDNNIPSYAAVSSWVELSKNIFNKKIAGFINAVLRKSNDIDPNKRDNNQTIGSWYSYPDWLVKDWIKKYGKNKTIQLCHWFNLPTYTDIRINSNSENVKKFISDLSIDNNNSPFSNRFIRIESGIKQIISSKYFTSGDINIQDRASGAIVELLSPSKDSIVLDVCAAPGSKSLYLLEMVDGKGNIFCSDIDEERVRIGKKRTEKLNLPIKWSCKDASSDKFPLADFILIDAPCSGYGVIRRRPDIRWNRTKKDIRLMSARQLKILNNMSKYLKVNGVLVYSTCSINHEENWDVVSSFLKLKKEFHLEPAQNFVPNEWINRNQCLETFPPKHNVDGMFAARLRKIC
tara:strand:- start:1276 stop:2409 length:1134 start_codon:yes stop_codon:yes gene_type:complete